MMEAVRGEEKPTEQKLVVLEENKVEKGREGGGYT